MESAPSKTNPTNQITPCEFAVIDRAVCGGNGIAMPTGTCCVECHEFFNGIAVSYRSPGEGRFNAAFCDGQSRD